MEGRERVVVYYLDGRFCPFREWRERLIDVRARAAVDARVARLRAGNFSDSKPIGGGASESRIDVGPGYRIYYGVDGDVIVLLCGGTKTSQRRDIPRAIEFWKRCKETKKGAGA